MSALVGYLESRVLMSAIADVDLRPNPNTVGTDRVQIVVDRLTLGFDLTQAESIRVSSRRLMASVSRRGRATLRADQRSVRRAGTSDQLAAALAKFNDDQNQFEADLRSTQDNIVNDESAIAATIANDRAALRAARQQLRHDLHPSRADNT